MKEYEFIHGYRNNDVLRESFNQLTEKTFCFNFRDWYRFGFWGEKYDPHSFLEGDRVIANISVNQMSFMTRGEQKNYIQLGTVMTDKDYRGQGLARCLMEKVLTLYQDSVDGIYLFGNDSVLDFYPKFGFRVSNQYEYSRNITFGELTKADCLTKLNIKNDSERNELFEILERLSSEENQNPNDGFLMRKNNGLYAFWLCGEYCDHIYRLPDGTGFVIAELCGEVLNISQILSTKKVNPEKIAAGFGAGVRQIRLKYRLQDLSGWESSIHKEEDSTLFILGQDLDRVEHERMMFSQLSHA